MILRSLITVCKETRLLKFFHVKVNSLLLLTLVTNISIGIVLITAFIYFLRNDPQFTDCEVHYKFIISLSAKFFNLISENIKNNYLRKRALT